MISTSVPLKRFMRGICATVSAIAVDLNSNPSLIGVATSYKGILLKSESRTSFTAEIVFSLRTFCGGNFAA